MMVTNPPCGGWITSELYFETAMKALSELCILEDDESIIMMPADLRHVIRRAMIIKNNRHRERRRPYRQRICSTPSIFETQKESTVNETM
jgi:hypothetical protein